MLTMIPNRINRETEVVDIESPEWITFCVLFDRLKRFSADSDVYEIAVPVHHKRAATRPILNMHLNTIR
jgi:hypothetical protein